MFDQESSTVDIVAFYQKDMRLKPYVALITGPDPKYRYAREFLRPVVEYFPYGKCFTYTIPHDGVYEKCIKTIDKVTDKLISRDRKWFVVHEGKGHAIRYDEIPSALDDLTGV